METFEAKPRWKGAPPVCEKAGFLSFKSKGEAAKFHEESNPHGVVLAEWQCKYCKGWHYFSGPPTDTNGQCVAGGDKIPPFVQVIIQRTKA